MTTLIIDARSPDGRIFELLIHLEDRLVVAETTIETYPDGRREWRDTRDVLLLVGRKPRGAECRS